MLRRPLHSLTRSMSRTASATPTEDVIRQKLTASLSPTSLTIHNDSHKHSHHAAMADNPAHAAGGGAAAETHFRVSIVSDAFRAKMQPARHRMVYAVLKEEMAAAGGIHALQLTTRTVEEERKRVEKEG